MKEARWYKKLSNKKVQCELCPNFCVIEEGNLGKCNARKNINGKLFSMVYGQPVATAVDPIEKKPLYHFLPGTKAYSIGTIGCNFRCRGCQNWELSRSSAIKVRKLAPKQAVENALANRCSSIAYTYNDPIVFAEYVIDISKIARKKSLKNVFVSNGYINEKPLKELCKHIDAAAIDLKGFSEKFYARYCEGKLEPVLETLKRLKKSKVWTEIIVLLIPGLNDSKKELREMCSWIVKNMGRDTILHFSRFFPYHDANKIEATPTSTLRKAKEIAENAGLRFVYLGNIGEEQSTYCPKCKKAVIERFEKGEKHLKDNACIYCGEKIPGVFRQ